MTERPPGTLPSAATIGQLLETIRETDIETVELQWGDLRVRVIQDAIPVQPAATSELAADRPGLTTIPAPLTGVYYARPSPDQPLFVSVGGLVLKGQTVGLIETMKLFNEVVAEVEGTVAEILVAEGDLVESGQPLMRVDTQEESAT